MPGMTKTRSILKLRGDATGGTVTFARLEDDETDDGRQVVLSQRDYEALGSPDHITVSIEPGNKLVP